MSEHTLYLFGYGSLVDQVSRVSGCIWPVQLIGFTRAWRHCIDTQWGKVCALTIVPNGSAEVTGVLIPVNPAELVELDEREIGYIRRSVGRDDVIGKSFSSSEPMKVFTYFSERRHLRPGCLEYPIWKSYVEYILARYIELFGKNASRAFIQETIGWEAPMLDDRLCPKYPRAEPLSAQMRTIIDESLATAGVSESGLKVSQSR
jgi:hypothetical protein